MVQLVVESEVSGLERPYVIEQSFDSASYSTWRLNHGLITDGKKEMRFRDLVDGGRYVASAGPFVKRLREQTEAKLVEWEAGAGLATSLASAGFPFLHKHMGVEIQTFGGTPVAESDYIIHGGADPYDCDVMSSMFVVSSKYSINGDGVELDERVKKVLKQSNREYETWVDAKRHPDKYRLSDTDFSLDHFLNARWYVPVVAAKVFPPEAQAAVRAQGLLPVGLSGSRYAPSFPFPLGSHLMKPPTPSEMLKAIKPFMRKF